MILDAARVLLPFIASFSVGVLLAPLLSHFLYTFKAWKKKSGKGKGLGDDTGTPLFDELHRVREISAPRMGGILVWISVALVAGGFASLAFFFGGVWEELDFIYRGQTWLPLFALLCGGVIGLLDDFLEVSQSDGGLPLSFRLLLVTLLSAFAGLWFYDKLDVSAIGIPLLGPFELGILFVPFFILVTLALYASGIIDGIDGLAGGIFAIIFMAYAGIGFAQEQYSLAAFSAAVSGSLFAFLWFNIPPARFYLSETGTMGLTLALSVTAFSTDVLAEGSGVGVLPIIALPLTATVLTSIAQVVSKKFFGKKLFHIAPIHHHFEAIGWPPYKVAMRYWVITIISSVLGLSLALL
ncbi:MAG: hypothetical protein WBK28_04155 [Minisyncoccia bacterium]